MAAIVNKKAFILGMVLSISFVVILVILFSPVFNGKPGLYKADEIFNGLAKGSTYFIPALYKKAQGFKGEELAMALEFENNIEKSEVLFKKIAYETKKEGNILKVKGDFGELANVIIKDTEDMYHNKGEELRARYGFNEKEVLYYWWLTLKQIEKRFKKEGKAKQLDLCQSLISKGLEASYNFYGIKAEKVGKHLWLVTFFLVFYIVYTIWWGFGIYFLFEGIGLKTTKAKVKKEA
jgi:hypothetical protein